MFTELLAKTCFSFLQGASSPEEMILSAMGHGYRAMAIVDNHGMYGMPQAYLATKGHPNFNLIVGAETRLKNGQRLCFLAQNKNGYGNLCELLTASHEDRDNPHVTAEQVLALAGDLFLLLPHPFDCPPAFKTAFGDRLFLVASLALDGTDKQRVAVAERAEAALGVPIVASLEPLYHHADRKQLQDVLVCIDHQSTLEKAGFKLLPHGHRHLRSPEKAAKLFSSRPAWIARTTQIADRCRFSLSEIRYRYPTEWIPAGETQDSYLEKLTWEGAARRYPGGLSEAATKLIRHELALVKELEYGDYFLTIWDITQFAASQNILFQGRGSAANSVVCYSLGITAIDPVQMSLLFERFISRERKEPPDIDIDFEHERREEVIQYIYKRYGRHRAAITANTICFRRKSCMREVGKVLGVDMAGVEKLQMMTHRRDLKTDPLTADEWRQLHELIPPEQLPLYMELCGELSGFPRHLGTHVGGFVLADDKLTRLVPVEKAAMVDRTIIQWNRDDLDAVNLVKVDVLGLGILTAIRKTFTELKNVYGIELGLADIKPTDPKVFKSIAAGDTVGIFQIESRAQMNMLPRLKPEKFYDLVVEVAIVRPGPIQGEMVHPYLRRRAGLEKVTYPHPELKAILEKTYGVPLFQEQIMKMAMTVAGFSGGEADELRRAMGTWRNHGGNRLSPLGEKFKKGLLARGIPQEFADRVFKQIEGFAEYGFPESHAASFALLAYATAHLRFYWPDCYLAGILNAQPMGFYQSSTLVYDAKNHGVTILPIDILKSEWDNFVESKGQVRLGFREVRGLTEEVGRKISDARKDAPTLFGFFRNLRALVAPKPLKKRDLFLLAGADAFVGYGLNRRQALWEIQGAFLQDEAPFSPEEAMQPLPKESAWEKVALDYSHQGVSLTAHPMQCFRDEMKRRRILDSREVLKARVGLRVETAGLVICRQMPPTAKGVLFITLEDEHGFVNLVVWRKVFEKYRELFLNEAMLHVRGKTEKSEGTNVTHFIVDEARSLFAARDGTPTLHHSSHDFA